MKKIPALIGIFCLLLFSCSNPSQDEFIPMESVGLNLNEAELEVGKSLQLEARISPSNATYQNISWSTSKQSVAKVSESGLVTAVSAGQATITASAGGKKANCVVTVVKPVVVVDVVSVTIDLESLDLIKGESVQLTAEVKPDDASDKTVTWTSSNASVATVSQDGKVTAVGAGTATVSAAAGGKSDDCTVNVTIPVESISINPEKIALFEGDETSLEATVLPEDATDNTVSWVSSDTGVATVDNGTVKALKEGVAVITAAAGEKTSTCVVTVGKRAVHVSSISLDRTSLPLAVGEEASLIATVLPENADDKSVIWESTNPAIAEVDALGKVTARNAGSVTVTATTVDGGFMAGCEVTVYVKTVPVESITLDKTSLALYLGQAATITATVTPSNATSASVTWSSDNESVALVSDGTIEAVGEGSATITAKAGDKTATCAVTVTIPEVPVVPVSSITLNNTSISLTEGETRVLTATVLPQDATDKTVTWRTGNAGVATGSNGTVTAIAEGTTTITATAGTKSATCTVSVSKNIIHVTSITINKSTLSLAIGASEYLSATVLPTDATDRSYTWSSSNTAIAQVDASGKVTAKSAGTVTVTATTNDGGLTAACEVTAYVPYVEVTSVTLNKYSLSLTEGESERLTATVLPDNATDKTVEWNSSNSQVATVNNGLITALKEGSASVTATAGGKTASCTVTVSAPVVPDPPTPPDPEEHPFTSNVTWTLGSRAYDHTTGGDYDPQSAVINGTSVEKIVKLGTSSANGDFTVNIPEGTTYIGFFALGWKNSTPKLTLTCSGSSREYDINANTGVSNTPPYTITTTEEDAYYTFDIPVTSATTVKFQSTGRVVVWGINAYNGDNPNPGGGDTPGGDTPGGDTPGGDDPGGSTTYAGWMELPATNDSNLYFVSHASSVNGSGRNYSYYWDATALVARWVAYPMNTDIIGTGTRTDKWAEDTALPSGVPQPNLKKAFNPSSYSRGHQIASADRLRYADNVQTFYYTNMTPQESGFNGGVWNSLEQKVRSWSGKFDTLYVVTGCVVEGSTKYALDNSGKRVTVPVGYYKALLGYDKSKKKGITSQTDGYTGIAFYFDHFGSYTSSAYMNQSMTIDELEEMVGVDFFVNLPAAVGDTKANKVESTSDSWWRNN